MVNLAMVQPEPAMELCDMKMLRPRFFDSVFIETAAGTNALPPKK